MEETSVETAGLQVVLEESVPFETSCDLSLGDAFSPDVAATFAPPPRTGTLRLHSLRDVELDTACCLLWQNGAKIRESNYLIWEGHYRQSRIFRDRLAVLPDDTTYVLAYNNPWRNYYHWTIQALSSIYLTVHALPNADFRLVLPHIGSRQEEGLRLLGLAAAPRISLDPHYHYAFPNLVCCEALWGCAAFTISRQVVGALGQMKAAVPPRSERQGIIYVARTDAPSRVVANEREVVELLQAEGVRIVVPGSLSVAEQIEAFRSARAVIGPHGAGLSNIVFCDRGTMLYELIPQHYINSCFARLAQSVGLHYWADLFPSVGDGGIHDRGWILDKDVIARRLAALRARLDIASRPLLGTREPREAAAPVFAPEVAARIPNDTPIAEPAAKQCPPAGAGHRSPADGPAGQSRRAERRSPLTRKRVLVTGGAGFLGSHLCERLVQQGHDVLCVDNYFTGRKDNIAHLLGNPRFEAMRHDVTFPLHVEVDEIYNLACPASPVHYQFDPVQTTKTSVIGAINMLGLAKRVGAKVLQASTSEVYGDPTVHPQAEDYRGNVNPLGPRACYDEGKRCAETLFFDYLRQHGVRIKVARIFNTFGPRMHPDDGRVVSNFIIQALRGQAITLHGDGRQTRAFCYVDDLIEGLIRLMQAGDDVTGPLNLGNPAEIQVLQLAETVLRLTGSRSSIVYRPLPEDDPLQRCPDIGAARAVLDWQPDVPLEQGLRRTIDYFSNLLRRAEQSAASA